MDFSNFRLYCQYPLFKIDFCWRDFINLGTARRPVAMEGVRSRIDQGFSRDYCFLTNEKENLPTGLSDSFTTRLAFFATFLKTPKIGFEQKFQMNLNIKLFSGLIRGSLTSSRV